MRIYKIVKATITAAAALAITAAPVLGADVNSTGVINSGDKASFNTNTTNNSSTNVVNNTSASVSQAVNATSNTGHNNVDGNISLGGAGASVNTGTATVNTALGVTANKNETAVAG